MRVLLTGATGFIGSHLTRLLVGQGVEVAALVRQGSDRRRVADVADRVRFLAGDLFEPESLGAPVRSFAPDLCVHLAWYTEPGRCLQSRQNLDLLIGSLALVKALDATGCRRLVLAGTSVEYDAGSKAVSEESPVRPGSLYASCKHALYQTASQALKGPGRSVAEARIFNVFGPWEDDRRLVPFVIRRLLSGEPAELSSGEQVRDYLHVEDVASAVWAVAASGLDGPFNVGSSHPVAVAALARDLAALVGRPDLLRVGARPLQPGEPLFLCADTSRLRRQVGWAPRYDLQNGLRQTVGWWRSYLTDPASLKDGQDL
jgi:nucleoside-diphosphate-sugar epimerase